MTNSTNLLQVKVSLFDHVVAQTFPIFLKSIDANRSTHDVSIKEKLKEEKTNNSKFAGNAHLQLEFIYRHSPYHENTHNLYPIGRVE